MTIEQTTFLGASITGFSLNLGWKATPSSLNCRLVADTDNGDSFNPGTLGGPKVFQFGDFIFRGILQSYKQIAATSGFTYEAILVDPRELLSGVQLVVEEYNGGVYNVPNVYNVFGALEAVRFGYSRTNQSGIPWVRAKNKLLELVNQTPISFRGYSYFLDLSSLPNLSENYRVKGPILSLMDFVSDICDAALHDFFFSLQVGNTITIHTVDRSVEPSLNRITNYLNSVEGAVSKEVGLELRNEVCSKLLIGGTVEEIYFQPRQLLEDQEDPEASADEGRTEALNTIWPFWGFDSRGNAILGREKFEELGPYVYTNPEHNFEADSRFIDMPGIGETYPIRLLELRCALVSQEVWEAYITWFKPDLAAQMQLNTGPAEFVTAIDAIFAGGGPRATIIDKIRTIDSTHFAPLFGHMMRSRSGNLEDILEEKIKMVYEFVLGIAQNYGRVFMVRIPDVFVTVEPETNIVKTSLEPVQEGYFSENYWNSAIGLNLAPLNIERLTTDEGKITAYVKYHNFTLEDNPTGGDPIVRVGNLKLTEIPEDDIILSANGDTVFIKCEVSPNVVFLQHPTGDEADDDNIEGSDDNSGIYSPRAVITLPGPIRTFDESSGPAGLLRILFSEKGITDAEIEEIMTEYRTKVGADVSMFGAERVCLLPNMAAIPLRNPRLNYGPWYSNGATGVSEVVIDNDLAPWNYGGFDVMNNIARSRVDEAVANGQVAETGTVEVPGTPALSLGGQLVAGGPYITDISVNIDPGGITTTYRMETWTRRFGKWAKANEERLQRFSKISREMRRNARFSSFVPSIGSKYYKLRQRVSMPPRSSLGASTHFLGVSEIYDKGDGTKGTMTGMIPHQYSATFLGSNYENKGLMSLDGLFRPFSTNSGISSTQLSNFETPLVSGSIPTIITNQELNPFKEGHDISLITHGTGIIPQGDFLSDDVDYSNQRGLALRGPLILSGWGYDTFGKPVPNSSETINGGGSSSFQSEYLTKSNDWKTGPIDLRWDYKRKVWTNNTEPNHIYLTTITGPSTVALSDSNVLLEFANSSIFHRQYSQKEEHANSDIFTIENDTDIIVPNGFYRITLTILVDYVFGAATATGALFGFNIVSNGGYFSHNSYELLPVPLSGSNGNIPYKTTTITFVTQLSQNTPLRFYIDFYKLDNSVITSSLRIFDGYLIIERLSTATPFTF